MHINQLLLAESECAESLPAQNINLCIYPHSRNSSIFIPFHPQVLYPVHYAALLSQHEMIPISKIKFDSEALGAKLKGWAK